MLNLFLENFVLIFVAIDPITILPIFATFTQGLNKKDLINSLQKIIESGDKVLFKGSRGMKMDKIIEGVFYS